eukprot:628325-Amphidinium_carterae.3
MSGLPGKSETVKGLFKGAKAKAGAGHTPPTVEKIAAAIDGDEVGERQGESVAWEVLSMVPESCSLARPARKTASLPQQMDTYGPVTVKHLRGGAFAVVCARGIIEDHHENKSNGVLYVACCDTDDGIVMLEYDQSCRQA